jgi:hypothetical protein
MRVVDRIDVDRLCLEAAERLLERVAHECRREVVRDLLLAFALARVRVEIVAELRRVYDAVAAIGEGLAELLFAPTVAVGVGGVEERDAGVERRVHQSDGFLVRERPPPAGRGRPQAEADDAHGNVGLRVGPVLHGAASARPFRPSYRYFASYSVTPVASGTGGTRPASTPIDGGG